jgi:mannose-6-phosphate isomerase-like protein (cupin superfamily)
MADYAVKRIDEMEAVYRGAFKRARAELGASAFGLQVIDMPPGADQYPEHDHAEDGQEEIYAVLRGSGEIEIDGKRHAINADTLARVASGTSRKVYAGPDGIRILIVGGVPGKAYEAPGITELGAPDPLARPPQ